MHAHTPTHTHTHRQTHRGIIEDPTCTCGKAVQTTDHLIFECETLTEERKNLKTAALQKGKWPIKRKKEKKRKKNNTQLMIHLVLNDWAVCMTDC
jgi:hypothetical protein